MAVSFSTAVRNSRLDAIVTAAGSSAVIRIYSGSRPATGGTETTILAELTCGATLGTVSGGVLTFGSVTQDSSANNTGTASWFRLQTSGGTHIMDGNVSTSGSDMNLVSTSITSGQPVSITSFTITEGNA